MTVEKSTGQEQINKNLPKEIKTVLGLSKYGKVQQTIYEKRKELKEKQYEALQGEKSKKEMDEKRESIRKTQQEIEDLENAEGSEREIKKLKGKLRTLEAEHNL